MIGWILLNKPFSLPQQKCVCVRNSIIINKESLRATSASAVGQRENPIHEKRGPGTYLWQPFHIFLFFLDKVLVIASKNIRTVLDIT